MVDLNWLAQEAKNIHVIFSNLFYVLGICLLLIGVLIEYFKWPLGGTPSFAQLAGRILVAAILLHTLPEVMNILADVTDGIAQKIGDMNAIKHVLDRMGDKLNELSWSWVSIKEGITLLLSFVTFFLLYFSVFVADAFMTYTWVLLYIFSPLLIALFVLPQTASATKALYKSLVEVSCWKIVWSVLATLVWSSALSQINKPQADINFVTVICLNLFLAGSLLLTPFVVHALAGGGFTGMVKSVGGIAVGATTFTPSLIAAKGVKAAKNTATAARASSQFASDRWQSARKLVVPQKSQSNGATANRSNERKPK
jgi:hypothetical protein